MNIEEAYKIVLKDLSSCNMFKGIYDAKNGEEDFMYGGQNRNGIYFNKGRR